MQSFFYLFTRYLTEKAKSQELYVYRFTSLPKHVVCWDYESYRDWDRIKSPAADQIVPYDNLPAANDSSILNKLAVLKVNGGLGT